MLDIHKKISYSNVCTAHLERYRSGHNEAVLKTVWGQLHMGSNPILSVAGNEHCPLFFYRGLFTAAEADADSVYFD